MDSQGPGWLGQAVVTSRLPCEIVGSPRRHECVPFVNIDSLRSRSIKRRQWKHKLDYYGVVFAHLATGCGINAKDPSGLDSDRWIPHSRCCENPARAKALAGFSRHLSAGFTDLNPAPRGLSLNNYIHRKLWDVIVRPCNNLNDSFNTLRQRQNGRCFADDTFKRIFWNENVRISIKISREFVLRVQLTIIQHWFR